MPLPWSSPTAWSFRPAGQPMPGDDITIPAGISIILDTDTVPLGQLTIEGEVIADDNQDVSITADGIVLNQGKLQIGSESNPFTHKATITLTGDRPPHFDPSVTGRPDNALTNGPGTARGLMVRNQASLILIGETPEITKTKLNNHANPGDTFLTFKDKVDWKKDDEIALAITDYYGYGETEILTLANDSNNALGVTLTTPVQDFRWGMLQYATPDGMSLTPYWGDFENVGNDVPRVLDERAEVVNMTRNIVIQGADDADWVNEEFGAHVMVMGLNSVARVDGVQFRRVGQKQAIGRYPFHWHVLSYSNGQYVGDVDLNDHYVKNSSVYKSSNRAVVIHGTCGATVEDTYAVDIKGHAFFLEDGSERRNTISDCVAMNVYNPDGKQKASNTPPQNGSLFYQRYTAIKKHDNRASGFWLTNPDNTIVRNTASECIIGIWNSFAEQCFGDTANVQLVPLDLQILRFEDNVGHSCAVHGMVTNDIVIDEAGSTGVMYFGINDSDPRVLKNAVIWKNNKDGYSNRVSKPHYINWIQADNHGGDFIGASRGGGRIYGMLAVGESLNNANRKPLDNIYPFKTQRAPRKGPASYHFFLNTHDALVINYPLEITSLATHPNPDGRAGRDSGGGFLRMEDLYLHSFESFYFMPGWELINSSAGFITPPPYYHGYPIRYLGGPPNPNLRPDFIHSPRTTAIEDTWGYWGPAGNYLIPNETFWTYDLDPTAVPTDANRFPENLRPWDNQTYSYSTPDRFFGIGGIRPRLQNGNFPTMWGGSDRDLVHKFDRLDSNGNVVASWSLGDASNDFDFNAAPQNVNWPNGNIYSSDPTSKMYTVFSFRHFGAQNNGFYGISFPGDPMSTNIDYVQHDAKLSPPDTVVQLITSNLWRQDDWVIFRLPWDGQTTPYGRYEIGSFGGNVNASLNQGRARLMNATGTSLQDVINSPDGSVMWQDSQNDVVWVKLAGGLNPPSNYLTNAERLALTREDVDNVEARDYSRDSLFQLRATQW